MAYDHIFLLVIFRVSYYKLSCSFCSTLVNFLHEVGDRDFCSDIGGGGKKRKKRKKERVPLEVSFSLTLILFA